MCVLCTFRSVGYIRHSVCASQLCWTITEILGSCRFDDCGALVSSTVSYTEPHAEWNTCLNLKIKLLVDNYRVSSQLVLDWTRYWEYMWGYSRIQYCYCLSLDSILGLLVGLHPYSILPLSILGLDIGISGGVTPIFNIAIVYLRRNVR